MSTADSSCWRWAIPCLIWFSALALATSASQSCSGITTIVPVITSFDFPCANYTGTIIIQSVTVTPIVAPPATTAPPTSSPAASTPGFLLNGLERLTGDLEFDGLSMDMAEYSIPQGAPTGNFGIILSDLTQITGQLSFINMTNLEFPWIQNLRTAGMIAFSNVAFAQSVAVDTTALPSLNSIGSLYFNETNVAAIGPLDFPGSSDVDFASITAINNADLMQIQLFGSADVHTNLNIQDNNPNLEVSVDMTTGSIQLSNAASLSLPSLSYVTPSNDGGEDGDGAQFISDNTFANLSLPNLRGIDGIFQIDGNSQMSILDLSSLVSVSTLQVFNNLNLQNVSFPNLSTIDGSLLIDGPVDQVSLPRLSDAVFQSEVHITVVSPGTYACPSKYQCGKASTSTTSGIAQPTSAHNGLSTPAKIGIGVGVGVGGALILAAIVVCCFRRRRKDSYGSTRSITAGGYSKSETSAPVSDVVSYNKIPNDSASAEGMQQEPEQQHRAPGNHLRDDWAPPEPAVPSSEGRVELEEQQGPRHEMDARSLPDMDMDDDDEDRRSLEDIERAHNQR